MGMISVWDGADLPPIGHTVLVQLGSLTDQNGKGGWVRHVVTGIHLKPSLEGFDAYHRIFIELGPCPLDKRSAKNERLLKDIRPLIWCED